MRRGIPPRPLPPSPAPSAHRPPSPFEGLSGVWSEIACLREAEDGQANHRLTADGAAAVATDFFYNEDMSRAPRGAKLVLLGEGGVASIGTYAGEPFWIGWAPLPKRRRAA